MNTYIIRLQYLDDERCEEVYRGYCEIDNESEVEDQVINLPNFYDLERSVIDNYCDEDELDEDDMYAGVHAENITNDTDLINSEWFNSLPILIDERDKIKRWILEANIVRNLDNYVCYCNENPVELLETPEYEEVYCNLIEELYDSFGYLFDEESDEEDEEDEVKEDNYELFYEQLSFEAYEENNGVSDDNYRILIDERTE